MNKRIIGIDNKARIVEFLKSTRTWLSARDISDATSINISSVRSHLNNLVRHNQAYESQHYVYKRTRKTPYLVRFYRLR